MKERDKDMGEEEEVRAFAAQIENEKLTDINIKFKDEYQKLVIAEDEEVENAFNTGTFKRTAIENVLKGTKIYTLHSLLLTV